MRPSPAERWVGVGAFSEQADVAPPRAAGKLILSWTMAAVRGVQAVVIERPGAIEEPESSRPAERRRIMPNRASHSAAYRL